MRNEHQIYLISDSTGETLDRIFLALKAQFTNFEYELNNFSFTRTENQIQGGNPPHSETDRGEFLPEFDQPTLPSSASLASHNLT